MSRQYHHYLFRFLVSGSLAVLMLLVYSGVSFARKDHRGSTIISSTKPAKPLKPAKTSSADPTASGSSTPSASTGSTWAAVNMFLQVNFSITKRTLTVTDTRTKKTWTMPISGRFALSSIITSTYQISFTMKDGQTAQSVKAVISLEASKPELLFTLTNTASTALSEFNFPPSFDNGSAAINVAAPFGEGFLLPRELFKKDFLNVYKYGGSWGMPFIAALDGADGWMQIVETPHDHALIVDSSADLFTNSWIGQKSKWGYDRKVRFVFLDKGGYVAAAKRFREAADANGLLLTLLDKNRSRRNNITKLIGAVDLWYWGSDPLSFVKELQALGFTKVLYSTIFDQQVMAYINSAGYLTSRYDIYQDIWPPECASLTPRTIGWPADIMLDPDGIPLLGWTLSGDGLDCTGGVVCPVREVVYAKQKITDELTYRPYTARFIDTTTASPWRECYHSSHPLTRSQDIAYRMQLLGIASGTMGLVTGSEDGVDVAVPFADYFEGMMSVKGRLPDSGYDVTSVSYVAPTEEFLKYQVGTDYRIPLWELVFHDCAVTTWYWGDSSNRIPELWWKRDLFNILYANMPLWAIRDHEHWVQLKAKFVASYKNINPVLEKAGMEEMLTHSFLTADHLVQQTTFNGDVRVVVNFSDNDYMDGNVAVKAHGYTMYLSGMLIKSGVCS